MEREREREREREILFVGLRWGIILSMYDKTHLHRQTTDCDGAFIVLSSYDKPHIRRQHTDVLLMEPTINTGVEITCWGITLSGRGRELLLTARGSGPASRGSSRGLPRARAPCRGG